ncbi:MAG: hypothetical protein ACO1O6_05100 [Bacteroidota bacterium]
MLACQNKKPIDPAFEAPKTIDKQGVLTLIADTIHPQTITEEILKNHSWFYKPFPDCSSSHDFNRSHYYNCEMDYSNKIDYQILGDTVLISEYDEPTENNIEHIIIKSRTDKFVFTGSALVMIGSEMYTLRGDTIIPKIKQPIIYEMNKLP